MAQLSDDCFAFGGTLQRLDDALGALKARLTPVAPLEQISSSLALGRVLAQDIASSAPVPNVDNSAVDGYAVAADDLVAGEVTRLPIGQRVPAGARDVAPHTRGTATRIFTGAPLPAGCDTVFMQEDVKEEAGHVLLPPGLKRGSNSRKAGEDFAVSAPVLAAGTRLKPQHLAALAAIGVTQVPVRRRLRVAVFSTGDEIVSPKPEAILPPGCQFDSNRPMLAALLAMRGMDVKDLGILPDRREAIASALASAAPDVDAILTSGGVSTGEEDHVKAAVEAAGRLDFWRLAIKPGRPIAMGMVGGKAFLGMPGNPAAVFVTFTRFVGPVLDMLAGAQPLLPLALPVRSGFDYTKKRDRREYVRAQLAEDVDGVVTASRFPRDGAALISSLIAADGLVELPEERTHVKTGETLRFLPFACLMG